MALADHGTPAADGKAGNGESGKGELGKGESATQAKP